MSDDLVERARAYRAYCPNTDRDDHPIVAELADEITRLRSLVGEGDELVQMIEQRIGEEFDGECHLTESEAHKIIAALSSKQVMDREAVKREIVQEICELPGDNDPDADDTLILSLTDLEVILDRALASPAVAENGESTALEDAVAAIPVDDRGTPTIPPWTGQRPAREAIVNEAIAGVRSDLAALSTPPAPAVEDGFAVVPREPTHDMLDAGVEMSVAVAATGVRDEVDATYRAMIAAAPPAKGAGE